MFELYKLFNKIFYATIIPGTLIIIWLKGLVTIATLELCLGVIVIIFVLLPLIFRYSVTIQRGILFLTFITYPKNLDLKNPESIGLYATRNFYVSVKDNDLKDSKHIHIGVWHVLPTNIVKRFKRELRAELLLEKEEQEHSLAPSPSSLNPRHKDGGAAVENELLNLELSLKSEFPEIEKQNEQLFYERILKLPGGTVILYLHGNTATRGSGHRSEIYKILRNLNYHVFTLDYRGYGDSDPVAPTEEGVVRDALAVYEYISNITSNPIMIWGHSLGTGVSCRLVAELTKMNMVERGPRGVILESPFTNIRDEIRLHPFAKPFKNLPWFESTISRPMYANLLRFESDVHIKEFRQPVMIIHAEDDAVVPFHLGYKLYRIAIDTRPRSWGPVIFHRFEGSFHYGHKYICRAPELPDLVYDFVENFRNAVY